MNPLCIEVNHTFHTPWIFNGRKPSDIDNYASHVCIKSLPGYRGHAMDWELYPFHQIALCPNLKIMNSFSLRYSASSSTC